MTSSALHIRPGDRVKLWVEPDQVVEGTFLEWFEEYLVEGLPFDADPAAEVTVQRCARIHRDGDPPDDVWEGPIVWRTCGDIPCGRQTDGTCDYVPCGETSR